MSSLSSGAQNLEIPSKMTLSAGEWSLYILRSGYPLPPSPPPPQTRVNVTGDNFPHAMYVLYLSTKNYPVYLVHINLRYLQIHP